MSDKGILVKLTIICITVCTLFSSCKFGHIGSPSKPENSTISSSSEIKQNKGEKGSTSANINNYGLVVQKGDWIYYNNGYLHKSKVDGTQLQKYTNDSHAENINVVDDWIYCISSVQAENRGIYKISTDFKEKSAVAIGNYFNINVVGDWIYCTRSTENDTRIVKLRTDGTGERTLATEFISTIYIDDGWIYFTRRAERDVFTEAKIYKMDTEGNNLQQLCEEPVFNFVVSDGWIYYTPTNDDKTLHKMRTDGSQPQKLGNDSTAWLNIAGEYIYYTNYSDNYKMYKVRKDGTNRQKVLDDRCENINIAGDWIYYSLVSSQLYRINVNSTVLVKGEELKWVDE